MNNTSQHEEITIKFFSEIFDKEMEEPLWAVVVDKEKGHYRIDSLPFYAPLIATNDVVLATFDEENQRLVYKNTVEASGNSTIHVVVTNDAQDIEEVRNIFTKLGCVSEKLNEHYFALEIPFNADYSLAKAELDKLEEEEIIEYAEPSLSEIHQRQTS
ncbi:DUF4265 domain-containing protein [Pontibacter harenae]|uniref:DUF4265 domain-containing protein n=1 Tax=Pontibacter harenae TaxID=2894083 RepID=UPI001E654492|nr:DUF4265 domain-containing protein [Pontibacter harenae]MCC9165382.1 DUF4265 domain-containing protein [Pontibacter harenae]